MGKRTINRYQTFTIYTSFVGEYQAYITASVTDNTVDHKLICTEIYNRIADILLQENMQIVHERLFGSISINSDILKIREKVLRDYGINGALPITYIQGQPYWGDGFAGVHLRTIRPGQSVDKVWTIYKDDLPCGRGWKRNGATFIILQNVHGLRYGGKNRDSWEKQTETMFDRTEKLLQKQGASYRNVVRTWIYLSNILDWYKEFNQARNAKYEQFHLIPNSLNTPIAEQIYLPASTGIMGGNPIGAAGTMDVLAVLPNSGTSLVIEQTSGTKQKSPFRYGSAFSRAMCIREKDVSHIMLSGTAAIDEQGKSLFPGDARAQIRKTIEVVDALISPEGASLSDICEATVFLKNHGDVSIYQEVIAEYGIKDVPSVLVIADICRDELLFELDSAVALSHIDK